MRTCTCNWKNLNTFNSCFMSFKSWGVCCLPKFPMEIQNLGIDDILDELSIILFSSPFFLGSPARRTGLLGLYFTKQTMLNGILLVLHSVLWILFEASFCWINFRRWSLNFLYGYKKLQRFRFGKENPTLRHSVITFPWVHSQPPNNEQWILVWGI